jgi:aminotransferase
MCAKSPVRPIDAGRIRARFQSARAASFTESVIREMTRLAVRHEAVNLAQGFPDFAAPDILKDEACRAIQEDINQYAITWGSKKFRDAIAANYRRNYGLEVDPEREITVCCGSTEGMISTLLAVTDPGDEIVVFEPYYENYAPDAQICGASRRFVRLHPPDWTFDPVELRAAFNARTKAIILNTPNNPTGRVFRREELLTISALAREFDCLVITDEIYEHITYDGHRHIPVLTLPGMRDRTVLVNSLSKTYSVTGWRVGWVIAAPDLTSSIRKVHDFVTVGAAAPLQEAGALAMTLGESYYAQLSLDYCAKRDVILNILEQTGFRPWKPEGTYYVLADISAFGFPDDVTFARHLVETIGVAAVPGSSFYENPAEGAQILRFCFCKKYETLEAAERRLRRLSS